MPKKFAKDPLEEEFKFKPSKTDVDDLRAGMKKFVRMQVNGRWGYPFEQYCHFKEIIRPGDKGDFVITDVEKWNQHLQIYEFHKWMQEKDQEALFQAFPEEKVKYEERVQKIKDEAKTHLKRLVDKMRVA